MECKCNTQPIVKSGSPVRDGEQVFWRQVFICNNPNCSDYRKEIGERLVNIFDEREIIEINYD